MYVRVSYVCVVCICITSGHVCSIHVLVHGHAAWSTRGAERVRTYVCVCMCMDCASGSWGAYECAPLVCYEHVCVGVCVRVRAGIVGDDALQTRVNSRGGREFLCASRPVFPLASPPSSQRGNPPRPATLPPSCLFSISLLPLALGLQPWPFREW